MSMKSSLVAHLRADSGVSGIVGQRVRLQYAEAPDSSRVIIHQVSGDHKHHMTAATGKVIGRFQLNCDGASPTEAASIAEAVRSALDGLRGTMGDVFVSMCHLQDVRDTDTPPVPGAGLGIYTVQQDYLVGWTVSVPTFA